MKSDDFIPITFIQKIILKWWLLFLAMLAGGVLGYFISTRLAPRYEAAAKISASIDYTISCELEDYQEDRAINKAGWLMTSDSVLKNVHKQITEQGIDISYQGILDSFSVERIDDLWTLRVTSYKPENAVLFANLWADEAYSQLDQASEHAQNASVLMAYIYSLESCLEETPENSNQYAICTIDNVDALSSEIFAKTELLNQELELSRALLPSARYALVSYAQTPTESLVHTRGILVLSGSFLGLICAFAFLFIFFEREKPGG
ncbi:MAG: hypothetical protein J7K66_04655 [Anaerolineaceae bacterium]|nr:hypothetical protein [Anaerolineaceae bacterium]